MSKRNKFDRSITLKDFNRDIQEKFTEEMSRYTHHGKLDKDATMKAIDHTLFTTDAYGDREITDLGDRFLQLLAFSMTTTYEDAYKLWDEGLRMEINEQNKTLHIYDATGMSNGRMVDEKKEIYIPLANKKPRTRTLDAATTLVDMIDYFEKRQENFDYETAMYEKTFNDTISYAYVIDTRRIEYKPNLKDYSDKATRKNAEKLDDRTIMRMKNAGENARKDVEYIFILKPDLQERFEKAHETYLAPRGSDEYWLQAQAYLEGRNDDIWGGSQENHIGEFFQWVNSEEFLDWTKQQIGSMKKWKELTSEEKAFALYQFYCDLDGIQLDNTTIERILGRTDNVRIAERQRKRAQRVNNIIEQIESGEATVIYKDYTPDAIEQLIYRTYKDPMRDYKTEWKISKKTGRLYRWYTDEALAERKKK